MSRIDPQQGLMPSLLDRLIDPDADGTSWRRGYGMQQMVAAVYRDLEDLLNTRQVVVDLPADCVELARSIFTFGMPDLASVEAITTEQRSQIGRLLETIIQRHEPRLKNIRATLLDPGQSLLRTVKFRIEARLAVDPAPEVAFDTILELTTGHSSISRPETPA
ncbi:MAG: type VI secretion system baseplate subunit TssE [Gemmataceae bacterium]